MLRSLHVLIFATLLTLALCATASADVFYTNLGPNGEYDTKNGWDVDGSGYNNQVLAMPFIPSLNGPMTDAVLALSNYAGGNSPINLYLYTDNGGQPGSQLATLTQQGTIQPYSSGGSLITFNCNGCGTINLGTQYWLVAWEQDPNTQQLWMWDYRDGGGNFAFNRLGSIDGPWTIYNGEFGGFRVDGTATSPEPGTLALLGSALFAAASCFCRRVRL